MDEKIVKDSQGLVKDLVNDCISRQAAIDAAKDRYYKYGRSAKVEELVWAVEALPSVEAIPVEWIERKIARLKEMDNAFASLAAGQIRALLNDWRVEQNEG